MQEQWSKISKNLEKILEYGIFKVWISPLKGRVSANSVSIEAPNEFMANYIKKNMIQNIKEASAKVLECSIQDINIDISTPRQTSNPTPISNIHSIIGTPKQHNLPIINNYTINKPNKSQWRYSFENFIVGSSNNVAYAAAQDISIQDNQIHTLFINSSSGLGKTHLTHATGKNICQNPNLKVGYLTAENFASRFVSSLQNHDIEKFKKSLNELDVLLLEDIHFLQGKEKMQDMALSIIKNLLANGGRVVITSSFSPKELQKMNDTLLSYFCSGILAQISKPDENMRKEIILKKAKEKNCILPNDVSMLLAKNLTSNIRQIESCIDSLAFRAKLDSNNVTLELANEVLQQYIDSLTIFDIPTLTKFVCEFFGLNNQKLYSRSRKNEYVIGRNTIYYLARKHTDLSLEEIGNIFNRKHSTVIKGITYIEQEITKQSRIGNQISKAISLIEKNNGLNQQL